MSAFTHTYEHMLHQVCEINAHQSDVLLLECMEGVSLDKEVVRACYI